MTRDEAPGRMGASSFRACRHLLPNTYNDARHCTEGEPMSVFKRHAALVLLLALVSLLTPTGSRAQGTRRCFSDVPGITNCIEGRFREYWEQNGGLAVFGYPTSPAANEQTAEGTFLTQY